MNSTKFPFLQFVEAAGLASPVAANYFYCSNQTSVPGLFVAAPGSQYPGGNGAMVTQGQNLPSSTSGSGAPSATGPAPTVSSYISEGNLLSAGNAVLGMIVALGASWLLI